MTVTITLDGVDVSALKGIAEAIKIATTGVDITVSTPIGTIEVPHVVTSSSDTRKIKKGQLYMYSLYYYDKFSNRDVEITTGQPLCVIAKQVGTSEANLNNMFHKAKSGIITNYTPKSSTLKYKIQRKRI